MYRRILFTSICVTAFLQGGMSLLALYLSLGIKAFDVSTVIIITSFLGAGGFIGGIIFFFLARSPHAKIWSLVVGATFSIATLFLLHNDLYVLCITALVCGTSLSLLRSYYLSCIAKISEPENLEENLSYRRLLLNIFVAVGSYVLALSLDIDGSLYVYACFSASLIIVLLLYLLPDIQPNMMEINAGSSFSSASTFLIFSSLLLALFPVSIIPNAYVLYFNQEVGIEASKVAIIFSINGVLVAALQVPMMRLTRFISAYKRMIIGIILVNTGVSTAFIANNIISVYALSIVWTLGEIILFVPFLSVLLQKSRCEKGSIVTLYQLTFSLSEFVSPLAASQIIRHGFVYLWVLTAISGVGATMLILFVQSKETKSGGVMT